MLQSIFLFYSVMFLPGGLSVGEKPNITENSGSESEDEVLCSHNTSAIAAENNIVVGVTDSLEKIACMCPNNKNCGANNAVLNKNQKKTISCSVEECANVMFVSCHDLFKATCKKHIDLVKCRDCVETEKAGKKQRQASSK